MSTRFSMSLSLCLTAICLSTAPLALMGQSATAVVEGIVMDPSGCGARGARVSARRGATVEAWGQTDADGRFRLIQLTPGKYLIQVAAAGFRQVSQPVDVGAGTSKEIQITLSLASLAETVTVTAEVAEYVAETATTGTKLELSRLEVPQSISVVPLPVLEDRVLVRLTESADHVAGVRPLMGYGGTLSNNYSFRGFTPSLTNINLRNGFAEYALLSQRDIANVDRIEFLKGPSSLLYGATEVGGLVNTITKKPRSEHAYEVGFIAGGFGDLRPTLDATGPINRARTLLYRLNAAYDRGDSYRDLINHENSFLVPALTWKPNSRTALGVELEMGRFVNDFDRGFPQQRVFLEEPFHRSYIEPWSRTRNQQINVMSNLTHQFSESWSVRSGFSHTRSQSDITSVSFGFTALAPDGRTINRTNAYSDEYSENYNSQNELYGQFATGRVEHRTVVGGEYARYQFKYVFNQRTLAPIDRIHPAYGAVPGVYLFGSNEDNAANQIALYFQDQVGLTKRLKVLVGGRISVAPSRRREYPSGRVLNEQTDRDYLPRAGLTYQFTAGGSAYFSFANSMLPNFASRQRNGEPFVPTKGRQYEVGWKQLLANDRIFASVAYFDLTRSDVLTPDPDDPTFTFSLQVGEQKSRGVEAEVSGRIAQSWNVIAAYTALHAFVTKDTRGPYLDDELPGAPRHSGSLYTYYSFERGPLLGFSLGAGVFGTGRRYTALPNPAWQLPGRIRTDLNFGYQRERWRVDVAIKNLNNTRYFELGGFNAMMPQAPRHALVSLKYRF